ncbi:MAG TPA: carboxypeptidase-like regulatory domain-containing protein, partial [Vicinamibacterales bacterium]
MPGFALVLLLMPGQFSQVNTGELRLMVVDATGLPIQGGIELTSEANQVRERLETDTQGMLVVRRLPFGTYHVAVTHEGFGAFTGALEIRSALPTAYRVTLSPAAIDAHVTVTVGETLLDPRQTVAV